MRNIQTRKRLWKAKIKGAKGQGLRGNIGARALRAEKNKYPKTDILLRFT